MEERRVGERVGAREKKSAVSRRYRERTERR
jgi:hypothetical protein